MRPRLLLNENVPLPTAKRLRAAGWDTLTIAEGHASIDDSAVMQLARDEWRWLITFDRDYRELMFRQHLPPPPLILLLRVSSYLPADPAWFSRLATSVCCRKFSPNGCPILKPAVAKLAATACGVIGLPAPWAKALRHFRKDGSPPKAASRNATRAATAVRCAQGRRWPSTSPTHPRGVV